MDIRLREDANAIIQASIQAVLPDEAVFRALEGASLEGNVVQVAAGKAAWQMAKAACSYLGERIHKGIVITKYNHVLHPIDKIICCEAGHPIPDENSFRSTQRAMDMVKDLLQTDTVLFLLSGGGSALFEQPLVPGDRLQSITEQLLACGADIVEINTIRKRLSAVKGGRFAQLCKPAKIFSLVLSDIIGDPLDMIASGPACADSTTSQHAVAIAQKYRLSLTDQEWKLLTVETPKQLDNVTTHITGSVRQLCTAAQKCCQDLGYETIILTDRLCCQAKEAGSFLASILQSHAADGKKLAFIAGGETVVQLTGKGKGGRNQELALSAALGINGLEGAAVFSVGSDGTDGPTDAAGGYVDYTTSATLEEKGIDIYRVLADNDAYHALARCDGLIFTGPTGTNVNDVAVALINR